MIIDKRASKWGYGLIAFAAIIFCGYFWLMLEPVQKHLIESGKHPSWILYALIGLLVGGVFGILTGVGFCLTKPGWFGIKVEAKIGDIIDSTSIRIWVIIAALGVALFSALLPGNI